MKHYIISEKTLVNLLQAQAELNFLESAGVDNWLGYSEGRGEFIKEELESITKEPVSLDRVYEEGLDMQNIAELKLKNFVEYKNILYEDDLK